MKRLLATIFVSSITLNLWAQVEFEKQIKKELKLSQIVWDEANGDGVFIAQSKENKKWGMYQFFEPGKRPKRLLSMRYDSLGFYKPNAKYTVAKRNGKYGVMSSPWNYDGALETLPFRYEYLRFIRHFGVDIIASKQKGKWGYLDPETGDTLIPFAHNSFNDLPTPERLFFEYPMTRYPEKLEAIYQSPDTFSVIDLSDQKLLFIPSWIGKCVNATKVNLEGNSFKYLPDSFFDLPKIQELYLGDNSKFIDFDHRFGRLTSLRTLVTGRKTSYGSNRYSVDYLRFDISLGNLTNLETLVIMGYLPYDSIPNFVYQLPNLKYLEVDSRALTSLKYSLKDLASKNTITAISLGFLSDVETWNAQSLELPNLEKVYMSIVNMVDIPTSFLEMPKLKTIYVKGFVKQEDSNKYWGSPIMDYTTNREVMTMEQRREAIEKWKNFTAKQK